MQFRSELKLDAAPWQLGYTDPLVTVGSCFADTMGRRLDKYKFRVLCNPFGVIYNPVSLLRPLVAALREEDPFSEDLFQRGEQWYSFGLHSDMRNRDQGFLRHMIAGGLAATGEALRQAKVVMLTYGTAIAFRHIERDEIVANCHKVPQAAFKKEMLSLEEMQVAVEAFLEALKLANPGARVLLSVSPVRHLRSGIVDNGESKARLRVLAAEMEKAHSNVHYFPAYEMLMDDLRDYRFYKDDLMHPSEMAEDYIWEKFVQSWIREPSREMMRDLEQALKALAHRPVDPLSHEHRQFLQTLENKLDALNNHLDLSLELADVREKLGGML